MAYPPSSPSSNHRSVFGALVAVVVVTGFVQRTRAMKDLLPGVPLGPFRAAWNAALGFFGLCLLGYSANILPYIFVARSTFVYHVSSIRSPEAESEWPRGASGSYDTTTLVVVVVVVV